MIPVHPRPEPADFDRRVRQPGRAWLANRNLDSQQALPPKTNLKPLWRYCLPQLHQAYQGICAYVCVFIEPVVGSGSVDHMRAKSSRPDLAYEWSNFRLACSIMNSRKGKLEEVLDPFEIREGLFYVEVVTGRIYPAPGLPASELVQVEKTIDRLRLDDPECRRIRADWFSEYVAGHISEDYLKRRNPLVWQEAKRQGLLQCGPPGT